MHAPSVHMHRIELGRNASIENLLTHGIRKARAIVNHDDAALVTFTICSYEDGVGTCVTRIAKHLDDNVLGTANIMLRLPSLRLANTKPDEAIAQGLFNPNGRIP